MYFENKITDQIICTYGLMSVKRIPVVWTRMLLSSEAFFKIKSNIFLDTLTLKIFFQIMKNK